MGTPTLFDSTFCGLVGATLGGFEKLALSPYLRQSIQRISSSGGNRATLASATFISTASRASPYCPRTEKHRTLYFGIFRQTQACR